MKIRLIETGTPAYEAMVELRMNVLLQPVGIPKSYINPEKEKNDLLVAAFEDKQLIGCCILTKIAADTLQLRQMAVDTMKQKKGVGAELIGFAEKLAKEKGFKILVLHARDNVLEFYKKSGYQITGDPFIEVGIGHYKMEKQLA